MQRKKTPSVDTPRETISVRMPKELYTRVKLAVPWDMSRKQFLEKIIYDAAKAKRDELNVQELDALSINNDTQVQERSQHATSILSWTETEVEIRMYATNRIGLLMAGRARILVPLNKTGLAHPKTGQPNILFAVLCGLAHGYKFGAGERVEDKDKACKSRLCKSLNLLTGIGGDPFLRRDKKGGYRPLFKVVDRRNAAAKRAKRHAIEVQFSETRDYTIEQDETAKWLDKYEQ
jgi:hypothetical protein